MQYIDPQVDRDGLKVPWSTFGDAQPSWLRAGATVTIIVTVESQR